jgi:uncharacterized protein (UPF0264 family)
MSYSVSSMVKASRYCGSSASLEDGSMRFRMLGGVVRSSGIGLDIEGVSGMCCTSKASKRGAMGMESVTNSHAALM